MRAIIKKLMEISELFLFLLTHSNIRVMRKILASNSDSRNDPVAS